MTKVARWMKKPITVDWSVYAQSLTDKIMKGMLTGPVTILNWSFPREDISIKDSISQIALAIRDEVLDLEALAQWRLQIANRATSAHDSVAAFSRLIAGLVELIFHVADAALHPGISRLLVAFVHLVQGKEQLVSAYAGELLAEELRLAQQALSEITGEFTSDDLLGRIFSSFCIGK